MMQSAVASSSRRSRTSQPALGSRSKSKVTSGRGPVVSFLQPIVSVRQRAVRLVEALARRIDEGGIIRSPSQLFAEAAEEGTQCELSQQCRLAALHAYRNLPEVPEQTDNALVLSINMDTALVREGAAGAKRIHEEISGEGVAPRLVSLEILESALADATQLEAFCQAARAYGYLLALDDMGTGHSNLERIPRLQPDILKVDRGLIQGMSRSYHQREVFRALMSLSHQIGALVIAEGVEDPADVDACLLLGCDLFQGYYFGRPWNPHDAAPFYDADRLEQTGQQLRQSATKRLHERRTQHRRSEQAMRVLLTQVRAVSEPVFDSILRQALARLSFIEALYVLNEQGIQVTDTIQRASSVKALYYPASRGADQSLKPYYLMLQAGLDRFTSDPYISSASGVFCVTMSRHFVNVLGQNYLLCCDITVPRDLMG